MYFVFLKKSAPSAPASQREFLCSFDVFIYLTSTWKQSVIHWCMCGESRIPKRWCNKIATCLELHFFDKTVTRGDSYMPILGHTHTHTCTGVNRYINLHNNWTEKNCFLSQCTVVCCVIWTLIKKARSKINILCAIGTWSGTSYGI